MISRPWKILLGIVLGGSALGWILTGLILWFDPSSRNAGSSTDATIGDTHYMGASNCDKAIKTQLTDPDSYQRIATQIVDVKPGTGWVARTAFRSRNGFGGYVEATADCVFDGNSYSAIVMQ
jgi:hypothetical protein